MRLMLAAVAATTMLAAGLAGTPAYAAAPQQVGALTVSPSVDSDGVTYVNVSWASLDPAADGAVVCLQQGRTAPSQPTQCESSIPVQAPASSSGLIAVHAHKNYTVSVFSYRSASPVEYGTPRSVYRHGVRVGFRSACGSQSAGQTCRITGSLTDVDSGNRLRGRPMELWSSGVRAGSAWKLLARVATDRRGTAHTSVTLHHTRLYQWRYAAAQNRQLDSVSTKYEVIVS